MNTPFADITVPVDGSASARRGIDYAIGLAQRGCALHFCSVLDASAFDAAAFDAEGACRDAIAAASARGIVADGKVLYGAIAPAIGHYASEVGSSALVIGTNARRGLSRFMFGSVAESLLNTSTVPVVIVHADDQIYERGPISVAIDDSDAAREALALAIEMARAWNESLAIVNVADEGRAGWREAGNLLDDAADAARAAGVDFELVTTLGDAVARVVDGAECRLSSMIVVGTDVRSPAARFVLGSVAAGILERARVPVTVVPHHRLNSAFAGRAAVRG